MSLQSPEQVLHDRVNLARLVRRLDKAVAESDWDNSSGQEVWLRSQSMLQKLKYARKLLRNVELYDEIDASPKLLHRHNELREVIDRLESIVQSVDERVKPTPPRPAPLLPSIPLPPLSARRPEPPLTHRIAPASSDSPGPADEAPAPEADLLLGPTDEAPSPSPEPSPANLPSLPSATTATVPQPAFLQNSAALQEELSAQLAQMAGQLRRNALHFSESLAQDQAVMKDTEEKIGANYDVMKKERVRLRDHRGKSMGTTCLTFLSLIVVLVAFILMFFVIRLT
ncbi:hypothetical protein BV25DRAFT_1886327 [Artomyces pyxidatus]|uniref:Uncharacterized protein n=1 Tax=Artomyces pyxidatus TaxID=48021 RepID=A0ACB8SZR5_9AGAM|nr:hypothetical protein BV25DRAFT_1886327 [Artomyces pyxidatus]